MNRFAEAAAERTYLSVHVARECGISPSDARALMDAMVAAGQRGQDLIRAANRCLSSLRFTNWACWPDRR